MRILSLLSERDGGRDLGAMDDDDHVAKARNSFWPAFAHDPAVRREASGIAACI